MSPAPHPPPQGIHITPVLCPQETEKPSEVTKLKEKVESMCRLLEDREKRRHRDEVQEAEREAKEEAMKPPAQLQPDVLHQRLVRLDEAARRAAHPGVEKYNIVLQRFAFNRDSPKVGQLVLNLLSTREEAALLEKERKFLKRCPTQPTTQTADTPKTVTPERPMAVDPWAQHQPTPHMGHRQLMEVPAGYPQWPQYPPPLCHPPQARRPGEGLPHSPPAQQPGRP